MKMPPDNMEDWEVRRAQIIGLGEHSARKSYYPELQQRLRELERTKSTLAAANLQLQAVLDAASEVAIIATNQEGIITIFNKGAEKMLGYTEYEVVGKISILSMHLPKEIADRGQELGEKQGSPVEGFNVIIELMMSHSSDRREWTYVCKDGKHILVLVTITAMRNSKGEITGFLSIANDITEQKSLESKLLQSQKMESIGQLAGGLAHDFNNVLSVVIGFASLLQMKLHLPENEAKMLDNILTASKKAANLTHSLLAFSRKQIMIKHYHNLNNIVTNVTKLLGNLIGEDIEFKLNLCNQGLPVFADSGQIEQVILNLATNARDAMPQGGLLSIITRQESFDEHFAMLHNNCGPGEFATIIVSDSGSGMDEETRKRIFEPFFTTKEAGKGTGLGLPMVYGIIKQHNGCISVYSEPGIGTTFQIHLPLIEQSGELSKDSVTQERDVPPGGSETILVAEDEAPVRELMENILTHFGYKVIMAENGQDAVDKFIQHKDSISMIILDMIMPQKSGKIAYDEIMKLQPSVKALFCSGYAPDIIQRQGDLQGTFDFLMKPVKPNELLRRIRRLLDS
ncbi:MAG TPA: ATP-binding protein [Deltaproteobacteria bacterium]|nr:ATP-binding protein [Deltaproteobacteria bacterium]